MHLTKVHLAAKMFLININLLIWLEEKTRQGVFLVHLAN